ncbi:hypothetical protein HDU97_007719 [Phlyctochytrium planicorne]|nr:hypothetical protein HDU97_007719 [Phlyctochytrium planicorne]
MPPKRKHKVIENEDNDTPLADEQISIIKDVVKILAEKGETKFTKTTILAACPGINKAAIQNFPASEMIKIAKEHHAALSQAKFRSPLGRLPGLSTTTPGNRMPRTPSLSTVKSKGADKFKFISPMAKSLEPVFDEDDISEAEVSDEDLNDFGALERTQHTRCSLRETVRKHLPSPHFQFQITASF